MQKLTIREKLGERRGLNLIELAIVMAVVGLIIGGIYVAASSVYRNVRETTVQQDVLQIVQNAKSTYGTQGTIPSGAIAAATAISTGLVPGDVIQGGALIDAFGGAVTLTGVAGPPGEIQIELGAIPQSVCTDLAVKTTSSGATGAAAAGLVQMELNSTIVAAAAFPIAPATAAADCALASQNMSFFYTIN